MLVVQVSRERALSVFASSSTLTWSETVSCLLAIGRCGTHNSIDNPSQFHPSNVRHHPFTVVSKWVRTGDTYKHRLLNDNPVPVLYLSVRVTWTLLTLNPRKVIGLRRLLNKYLEEKIRRSVHHGRHQHVLPRGKNWPPFWSFALIVGYRVSRVIFLVARRDRPDTFTRPKGRRLFSFFLSLLFLSSSRDYRTTIPFSADSFPLPFCLMTLPLANKNDTEIGFRVSIANFFFFQTLSPIRQSNGIFFHWWRQKKLLRTVCA